MAMKETYSLVVDAEQLKSRPVLQDIAETLLKQMIECGYFIHEYARRNFVGKWCVFHQCNSSVFKYRLVRSVLQPLTGVNDRIAAFCTVFANLRNIFDSRLNLSTALDLSRENDNIDTIGVYRHSVVVRFEAHPTTALVLS